MSTSLIHAFLLISTAIYLGAALAFLVGLRRRPRPGPAGSRPFVSVVIAARNEAGFIGDCLEGLARQTYPADRYEVLVVDDGSTDGTMQVVTRFATAYPIVRCIEATDAFRHMAAKKRPLSEGIRAARGRIILTTDADCSVPATWISGVVSQLETGADVVIGFSQVRTAADRLTPVERLQAFDFLALMSASAGAANLGVPLAASGQNFAYRKALFDRVNGFEAIAHCPSGDDVLLLQLFRRAGARIAFSDHPHTFVSTRRAESIAGFWTQRRRWASNARIMASLNPVFFAYLANVFLINLLIPSGIILGAVETAVGLPLSCLAVKALADLGVVWRGTRRFGRTDLLPVLPVWVLLQIPYTVLVGLFGTFGRFVWKGRTHPAGRVRSSTGGFFSGSVFRVR
ncbi:MAG: glycosyltransferase [Gemmatimonadota bacterium]|nr:glycosyltransferase [Gemmatimonadota bacterium]